MTTVTRSTRTTGTIGATETTGAAQRRLRYGELDSERVVTGLLGLASRVGVGQVTMRALAAELGTSAAALYYHVPNKQTGLDLLAEAVLSQVSIPTEGAWEERLKALYAGARLILLRYPGITSVLQRRPPLESGRRLNDFARDTMCAAQVDTLTADHAQSLLSIHLLGSVALEHALATTPARLSRATSDTRFSYGLRVILSGIKAERDHL